MGIFGNMKIPPFLSRVLTSLKYQDGHCGCRRSQLYHYRRFAMLKIVFVAPKFRLRRVKKGPKWRKNWEIAFCKKKLRCANLEISPYNKIVAPWQKKSKCVELRAIYLHLTCTHQCCAWRKTAHFSLIVFAMRKFSAPFCKTVLNWGNPCISYERSPSPS